MKLGGRDAARWLARPGPEAGVLLYGADAMRVALRRTALVEALVGPDATAEMRLVRMTGAELRRDPAALMDAIKATGFFPGPRAVLVEEAGDGNAGAAAQALAAWTADDARIVVTAGALRAGSGLRKAFESARNAFAIGIYDDPMSREEIAAAITRAGVGALEPAASEAVEALSRSLDPGDFAQFLGKLGLYKGSDASPVTLEEVEACAPDAGEPELDSLIELAAAGEAQRLALALRRVGGRTATPVSLAIAAGRHFRALHAAATAADGPEAALGRQRPPVFGPRRSRMAAAARAFGPARLETALGLITETDLTLRSGGALPGFALVERMLVRIAMLRGR